MLFSRCRAGTEVYVVYYGEQILVSGNGYSNYIDIFPS